MIDIDYCIIDGTFYSAKELEGIGRSYIDILHPLISASMEKFDRYKNISQIYFTHFNHLNPAISMDRSYRKDMKANGFFVLEEGQEFLL